MSPPAYIPVPLSPIDEEKAMLASYDGADKEATRTSHEQQQDATCCQRRPLSSWARGMLIALRLVTLVVLGLAWYKFSANHGLFSSHNNGNALMQHGEKEQHPHGPPPPHHHRPHFGRPRAIECFDISAKDAVVNASLVLHDAAQPIFLMPGLAESADIAIIRTGKTEGSDDLAPPPPHGPPPHGPPGHGPPPHGPPGHGPPPHGPPPHGPPHMPCHHGKPTTIMVQLEREEAKSNLLELDGTTDADAHADKSTKGKSVYFCSLRMPMGQSGLGLFHHDISKKQKKPEKPDEAETHEIDEEKKKEKAPKAPKIDFPHVGLKINVPAGQPFTLTSGPPPPPPPMRKPWFHWGPPRIPSGPWPHPHPRPEPPHRHHGKPGVATLLDTQRHQDTPKSHRVIIVTITRVFSKVRKVTGCRGRALVRKIMGKH